MSAAASGSVRIRCGRTVILAACALLCPLATHAEIDAPPGSIDSRVRSVAYVPGEVYRLHGFVGYQIDLEFEAGESFVGLSAGDIDALAFAGRANHLFLKPKAAKVVTNITVLTTRRTYQFAYTAAASAGSADLDDLIYALRFTYVPTVPRASAAVAARRVAVQLDKARADRPLNVDYWYCGDPQLKPTAASDDGVETRLRFGAHAEMPVLFVRNDDGSDSLLNFSIDRGDVIIQRVAHRLIVRRGRLHGCIVNAAFAGGGERLKSGTVAPDVERVTQGAADERQ